MKYIINLPDKTIAHIRSDYGHKYFGCIGDEDKKIVMKAIYDGTPLSKGHGDLIDRTEVIKSLFDYHNGKKTIGQCIDDVPTIIKADKENE